MEGGQVYPAITVWGEVRHHHKGDAPAASAQMGSAEPEEITQRSHPTARTHHHFSLMPSPSPPHPLARSRTALPTLTPPSHLSMPYAVHRQEPKVMRNSTFMDLRAARLVGRALRLVRRKRDWKWHLHERAGSRQYGDARGMHVEDDKRRMKHDVLICCYRKPVRSGCEALRQLRCEQRRCIWLLLLVHMHVPHSHIPHTHTSQS